MLLSLVLGIALGLSLMIVAVALTPGRVMRRSVAAIVEDRRETLLYGGWRPRSVSASASVSRSCFREATSREIEQ